MPDLLCFSSTDWDGVWGSRQQIMLRLSKLGYRVLYVERPVGPEHLLRYPTFRRNKIRRWLEGLRLIDQNIWVISLPLLLPGRYYFHFINRLNQSLQVKWIRRYLHHIQFRPQILWLYKPEFAGLVGCFGERVSVYHCIDEFSAGIYGRKKRIIEQLEEELIRKVDLVFANSNLTYEKKRALKSNTFQIKSAADVDHFGKALDPNLSCHPAIIELPRPLAGFIGNLTDRIDYRLLVDVAQCLPAWRFVFIGQEYPALDGIGILARQPNVTFLGKQSFQDLPAFARCVDVFLLPYVRDEKAVYRSPLKLYEYLATGRPIVSTPHPEVTEFGDLVYVGSTPDEFAALIQNALVDSQAERDRRRASAQEHSWDQRVQTMVTILHRVLEEKEGGSP